MNKTTLLASILCVALIVSVATSTYLATRNMALSQDNTNLVNENQRLTTRTEMVSALTQVQVQVDAELQKIGCSITYACEQLSTLGLEGNQVRQVLTALAANSSYIVDAVTVDLSNTLVTVVPDAYQQFEGVYIGEQYLNTIPTTPIRPCMTSIIPLVEGLDAPVIAAPVFNATGVMVGSISVIVDINALFNQTVADAIEGTAFTAWALQTNGLVVYDMNPEMQGVNLFTDPTYTGLSQMQTMVHQMTSETAGCVAYQDGQAGQLVSKEAYWATVGPYGTEWRIIIVNAL
jgi:hypothetical protein